jgi:hypothetical protein
VLLAGRVAVVRHLRMVRGAQQQVVVQRGVLLSMLGSRRACLPA